LRQLQAQTLHRQAVADQPGGIAGSLFFTGKSQRLAQQGQQVARVAGLADEFDGAQRARMTGVVFAILTGENNDFHVRRVGQQVADQREALIRAVRLRRQAKID